MSLLILGILGRVGPDSTPPLRADALIRDRRVAWVGGFGISNTLTRDPVTSATVFPAASLGKPATAHAALRLASRGDLSLDRPLASYLAAPWLGDSTPITLRHVLAHTSGLSNFLGDRSRKPRFPPGEEFAYSGVGFMYLQHVLEKRSGAPLDSVVTRETFRPLGIGRAWFGASPADAHDIAAGHVPLGWAVVPFGIVFLPIFLVALAIGSVIRRIVRGSQRSARGILAASVMPAAFGATAFLYAKASSPRLVPYFVLTFALFALGCVAFGRLIGAGRLRVLRIPVTIVAAVGIFAFARTWPLPVPHGAPPQGNAASSLRASVGDLALLAIELGRPALLDSALAREMLADQSKAAEHLAWGLGVGLQRAPGADAVFHWGRNPAVRSALVYYLEAGAGVVVLANSGTAGDAVAEVALRSIGGPSYWADE